MITHEELLRVWNNHNKLSEQDYGKIEGLDEYEWLSIFYEMFPKYITQQEMKDKLLGLYKQVDEFYRKVTRDGDYNAVIILYQQIKALEEELK